MGQVVVTAEKTLKASPERVFEALADYTGVRSRMLTEHYSEYDVREGGQGEGTVVHWKLAATSKRVRDCLFSVSVPSADTLVMLRQLGGAMSRVPAEATAFGDRSAPFHLSIDSTWDEPEDDLRNIEWTRAFWNSAQRFSSGQVYFNFAGLLEEGERAVRSSFGRNYERLVYVNTDYDPENVFRSNRNIAP